jgi:acylphosphatase
MTLQARLTISGRVQGVGYRDWTITTAQRLGLTGWVRNRMDGAVEALIVGDDQAVGEMIDACRRGPRAARVDNVDSEPVDLDVLPQGFTQLPTV